VTLQDGLDQPSDFFEWPGYDGDRDRTAGLRRRPARRSLPCWRRGRLAIQPLADATARESCCCSRQFGAGVKKGV